MRPSRSATNVLRILRQRHALRGIGCWCSTWTVAPVAAVRALPTFTSTSMSSDQTPLLPVDNSTRPSTTTLRFKAYFALMIGPVLVSLLFVYYAYATLLPRGHLQLHDALTSVLGVSPEVQLSWAMYSPYFPAALYRPPPTKCKINQVRDFE